MPQTVQIAGIDGNQKKDLEAALAHHAGGQLDTKNLEDDLRQLSGVGRYSRFSYRVADNAGKPELVVTGEERGYAPPFLNLGVIIDGSDYNNVRFSMTGRVTALDFGGYRSEWRTDFSVGSTWALGTEYYRPFSPASRWFVAPHLSAANSPFDLYNQSKRLASYRFQDYAGGLDAGYAINRFSEVRLGYTAGYFQSGLSVGTPVLPTPSGRTGATAIRYNLDKLDNPIIPRDGLAVRSRVEWYDAWPGAANGFPLAELSLMDVVRVSRPASVYFQAYGGSTFGHDATGLPQFFLGGPTRLGAYGTNELRGDQYFLGRVGYLHELFKLPPLVGGKTFFTSAFEIGKMYGPNVQSRLPMDGAVGLVMQTFLGPVSVGGSVGDRGHRKWYFEVGRMF